MLRYCFYGIVGILLISSCSEKLTDKQRTEIFAFTAMSDLATVEYTLSKVVKANDNKNWYKLGNRKIVMSVMAYAKAGIDLSQIKQESITRKNGAIHIVLPPAKLISLSIPPEEIKQEMTEIDPFRSLYTNAEKDALLVQAENSIRHTIDSLGILKKAEENAQLFIGNFVKRLGYNKVNIEVDHKINSLQK